MTDLSFNCFDHLTEGGAARIILHSRLGPVLADVTIRHVLWGEWPDWRRVRALVERDTPGADGLRFTWARLGELHARTAHDPHTALAAQAAAPATSTAAAPAAHPCAVLPFPGPAA